MNKRQEDAGFSAKDQAYMKKYVESHPDSRMAWYLLGKEYERMGELNKARYCFNEAGDIYKAFENEPLPVEMEAEAREKRQQIVLWKQDKKRRQKLIMRTIATALFLLIMGTILITSDADAPSMSPVKQVADPNDMVEVKKPNVAVQDHIYLSVKGAAGKQGELLAKLLQERISADASSLIVEQDAAERWKLWTQQPQPVYVLQATDKKRISQVTQLQLADCECEEERAKSKIKAQSWAEDQERMMQARSILSAVLTLGKKPPSDLHQLAAGYPNNTIAGVDKLLIPYYEKAYAEWKAFGAPLTEKGGEELWKEHPASSTHPFGGPLRIVVDKANHRLALISGDQILRNYEVGLGGKRTPEGEFVISEKVVNPNGSATGAFGSRGMTLSDTLYAIHGTDEPESMGQDQSLGCVRMLREDVEELFDLVPMGTKVTITSGVLPDEKHVPEGDRYRVPLTPKQDNPHKIYKWL